MKYENLFFGIVLIWLAGFIFGISMTKNYFKDETKNQNETERYLCKQEFNEDLATVSIEHKSPILHKGTKPNRILIICQ